MSWEETIAAIATPIGTGGIGIIRVSGDRAMEVAGALFHPLGKQPTKEQESHSVRYGKIIDPKTGELLDEGLLLYMKAPHTFTGEDVVEFQCHGGMYLLRKVLQTILTQGVRLAEPGEFTKRAFLHGRIDLSQAESIMDMISAQTNRSLQAASRRLEGRLGSKIQEYRKRILDILVLLEVEIDYPEYEIEESQQLNIQKELENLQKELSDLYRTADTGRMLNEGIRVALVGRPNMGKSTLLNTLLGENRAIVTDIPGTTRDTLEEGMNLDGIPLRLVDTAGIRESQDPVEAIGVERALEAARQSDLVLFLLEGSAEATKEDQEILQALQDKPCIIVRTKLDQSAPKEAFGDTKQTVMISARTGEGIDELKERICQMVWGGKVDPSDGVYLANARQQQAVYQALSSIQNAQNAQELGTDLISMDLQNAYDELGELTGNRVRDDLVDEIFSRFCLGK